MQGGIADLHLTNNSRCDLREAQVCVRHIAAVYLPQTDPVAIDIAFPVVRVAIENLHIRGR
jgi:hypothetical protein